ncbi:MAG: carboxymuconolactone decarboxylase family protein [Candidatus Rokubacteria bacterium]|nr:carboxymuconolactone decarboxylase family protein [Candidatus Rokubacteria bacterium]
MTARIPLIDPTRLDDDLKAGLGKWQAEEGDPNFYRLFGRLPETLRHFIRFYSPLVRRGVVEHRTKELVRLRLARLNDCHY